MNVIACKECGRHFSAQLAYRHHLEAKHGRPQQAVGRAMRKKKRIEAMTFVQGEKHEANF